MITKLIKIFLCLSTLCLASLAGAANPQPEKCPGVSSIQQTAFIAAGLSTNGKYMAIQISHYDTAERWVFGVINIDAGSNQDAAARAASALGSLVYSAGPIHMIKDDKWACIYGMGLGYEGVAVEPLKANTVNASEIIKELPAPSEILNSQ